MKFYLKTTLLTCILLAGELAAEPASYSFCVSSKEFPTFKAEVVFRAVDFGENAARQMVINHVKEHLGKGLEVSLFNDKCECKSDCPLLSLTPKNWDGKMSQAESATLLGTAAESLDMIIYNAKEIFRDPGGYIKKIIFGKEED